jgi:hypothetical protein
MGDIGYELRAAHTGEGVFATRDFAAGELVMRCIAAGPATANDTHANQVGPGAWVHEEGLAPKLNHSCDPNCGVAVDAAGDYELRAREAIAAGDELTFDYAMRNYVVEHCPASCRCGTAACRGAITGWRDLPADRKAAYAGLVAPYLLELDRAGGQRAGVAPRRSPTTWSAASTERA